MFHRTRHVISAAVLLGVLFTLGLAPVFATAPELINYQGILKTASGNPVPDAMYSITFGVYPVPAGGTLLWTETQNVSTAGGLFTVILGQINPLPASVFSDPGRFLSIAVSPDPEMSPRTPLVTVPYAHRITEVDGASGGYISGNVTISGKATIGPGETNSGFNSFVAGSNNTATGDNNTISGGDLSVASGDFSTIGGGQLDSALGTYATVGGGCGNFAAANATVGGGIGNRATTFDATVGGGYLNVASGARSAVAGGDANVASGARAAVGGGYSNGAFNDFATVAGGDRNTASGLNASIGGGSLNSASGDHATVSGGTFNTGSGNTATVGGGTSNTASNLTATVGGGYQNTASGDRATVGGGFLNAASGNFSTVGGGESNIASGIYATVGGGRFNSASGDYSTAGGGVSNIVSAYGATVAGGGPNTASGILSTVPGGAFNVAGGDNSVAAGANAHANHHGSVVIATADQFINLADSIRSGGLSQMVLYAKGGLYITNAAGLATYDAGKIINTPGGAYLSGNGTTWTNASDRNRKENFAVVDRSALLKKIAALPITRWNYRDDDPAVQHIGPVAQDFRALFGVGNDDKSISTIDPAGIALAAIQELYRKSLEIDDLRAQLNELRDLVVQLQTQQAAPEVK